MRRGKSNRPSVAGLLVYAQHAHQAEDKCRRKNRAVQTPERKRKTGMLRKAQRRERPMFARCTAASQRAREAGLSRLFSSHTERASIESGVRQKRRHDEPQWRVRLLGHASHLSAYLPLACIDFSRTKKRKGCLFFFRGFLWVRVDFVH